MKPKCWRLNIEATGATREETAARARRVIDTLLGDPKALWEPDTSWPASGTWTEMEDGE